MALLRSVKKKLHIIPHGRHLHLKEGKYNFYLKRINDVLYKLGIRKVGETYIVANSDLRFENGKKEAEIKISDGVYFEIQGNREKYIFADLGRNPNEDIYLVMKKVRIAEDGSEIPLISQETRALGGYFYTGIGGPLATYNPALYGEKELVREVHHLPTFVSTIALYENGKRIKTVLWPWDHHTSVAVEDPRITTIDGRYVMFVTEYNFVIDDIKTGVYVSDDFLHWKRVGQLYFPEIWENFKILNKAMNVPSVYLDGKPYYHWKGKNDKIVGIFGESSALVKVDSKNLSRWRYTEITIRKNETWWASTLTETGAFVEFKDYYLLFMNGRDKKRRYSMGWVLMDKDLDVVDISENPIIAPTEPWERAGIAANVIFNPGGFSTRKGKTVFIYGAADQRVGRIEYPVGYSNTLEVSAKEFIRTVLEPIAYLSQEFWEKSPTERKTEDIEEDKELR